MTFVLNFFKGSERKTPLGYLPPSRKKTKKKTSELEDVANDFMSREAAQAASRRYGVSTDTAPEEQAEDMPNEDDDDQYYSHEEKQIYERPRPQTNAEPLPIRWQKGGLLGVGAYGKVYLGLNLDTGELIAVKQISLEQQQEKEARAIEHEVRLLRNLHHENIVQYFGTSVEGDALNIFLEYVPGGSISSLLLKFQHFSEQVIQVYTRQLLLGLEYLHRHQIVHRDIKGANILVDNSGVIKLADFGASKTLEGLRARNTTQSGIKGTPLYMAPEVIKQLKHGRQADIWSVGCTVIEMATGQPPWHEFADNVSALFHIGSSNAIPTMPAWLSPVAKDFLLQCLRRDPMKRPTATKLLEHPFVAGLRLPSNRTSASSSEASSIRSSPVLSRVSSNDNLKEALKKRAGPAVKKSGGVKASNEDVPAAAATPPRRQSGTGVLLAHILPATPAGSLGGLSPSAAPELALDEPAAIVPPRHH
jgi:serine/threonine protein kinase